MKDVLSNVFLMVKRVKKKLETFLNENHHLKEVTKKGSSTFVFKVLATGAAFFFNLILANVFGAEVSGEYFLSLTVILVGLIFCKIGLDKSLMRFVAEYVVKDEISLVRDLYIKSVLLTLVVSTICIALIQLFADEIAIAFFGKSDLAFYLQIMSLGLFPAALTSINAAALKGLKETTFAAITDPFLFSVFNVVLIYPLYLLLGIKGAAYIYVVSQFLAAGISFFLWGKSFDLFGQKGSMPYRKILNTSLPLLFVSSMEIIIKWTDTVVLGVWVSSADVGIYNIALRIALITSFILVAVNSITAPKFSELYHSGEIKELEDLAQNTAALMAILALPVLLFCLIFPHWILGLFGNEFIAGTNSVRILAVGQYLNVMMGSVGYLLIMTGYEKTMQYITLFVAFFNIAINILMVPILGIEGAAFATMSTLIIMNLLGSIFVFKKIGIIVFPLLKKTRSYE
ncbi:flippase [Halalkalibaculum sp. DA3122]|uniref:flippase n=1 Tax=Halalkalibaculum sp. DA3122 TaxID=3373607 RepID=UPI003754567F